MDNININIQRVMEFFDKYSRFFDTSSVGNWPDRLNSRYRAIISANKSLFDGARVLDLASHDGRWSYAALDAGDVECQR